MCDTPLHSVLVNELVGDKHVRDVAVVACEGKQGESEGVRVREGECGWVRVSVRVECG